MSRRVAFVGALLVLLPAAVVTHLPRATDGGTTAEALARSIPTHFEDWSGVDSLLDADTLRLLRTDDYLNRTYAAPGRPSVTLTIVSSRRERKTVHPPEVCFTAQGWEIEAQGATKLHAADGAEVEAATLRIVREDAHISCLYWYVAAGRTTPSYVAQQWNVAAGTLAGDTPGSAMVRLIVDETGAGADAAEAVLREFTTLALPSVQAALR